MRNRITTISDKTFVILLMLVAFAYHAVVGLQGFDMYDEGFSLTGYQQIFSAPESIEYLFLYYLNNVAGGLWNLALGWGGIYSFRILTGLTLTLTAYVCWLLLRPLVNRWCIAIGVMMSFLCCYYGIMVFYHNYLTALLSTFAAYCLVRALTRDSMQWMLLSGFTLGCNIFVRLPNVTLLAFVLLLIPYYIYRKDGTKTLKMLGAAAAGVTLGVAAVVLLMLLLGHLSIFINAVNGGFSAASDASSTHNLSAMFATYLKIYRIIFTIGFFGNVYSVYLFGTIICLWVILSRRYTEAYVYTACTILFILHCLPLGSDWGVQNMGENCVFLATPFCVGIVSIEIQRMSVSARVRHVLNAVALFFALLFMARGVKNIMLQCYFDEGSRTEKTYRPAAALATTYTTQRNCEVLNSILDTLAHYVKPGDELLCFQNMPTLHYLTQTRPYLGNPWLWCYDTSNMERHFQEAERRGGPLPVMVREKAMIPYWTKYYPDWDNTHVESDTYLHKNKKITLIQQFIRKHHYRVVWENDICQILIPTS